MYKPKEPGERWVAHSCRRASILSTDPSRCSSEANPKYWRPFRRAELVVLNDGAAGNDWTAPPSLVQLPCSKSIQIRKSIMQNKETFYRLYCTVLDWYIKIIALWHSGIGSRLGRNRLWVRFLAVSDIYPMFIEPTITWVPSGFSGYIWLDTKIVLKKKM